jgi:hypothetical protein
VGTLATPSARLLDCVASEVGSFFVEWRTLAPWKTIGLGLAGATRLKRPIRPWHFSRHVAFLAISASADEARKRNDATVWRSSKTSDHTHMSGNGALRFSGHESGDEHEHGA